MAQESAYKRRDESMPFKGKKGVSVGAQDRGFRLVDLLIFGAANREPFF